MSSGKTTVMSPSSKNVVLFALIGAIAIGAIISYVDAKPPSRIKNGHDAPDGDYTWVVSILKRRSGASVCGGAIISPRHVLTAGHCLYNRGYPFYVRSGSVHANSQDALVTGVSQAILHPGYVHQIEGELWGQNDIAILVLEEDLPLDEKRTMVSLPTEQVIEEEAFIAGWGIVSRNPTTYPTTLQTAVVHVNTKQCPQRLPQLICGYQTNGYILNGDSGSPLVSDGAVIGIASSGGEIIGALDMFTNVYHYVPWIDEVVN